MVRAYRVRLQGLTPLLMHADNIEWADKMEAWKSDPDNRKFSKAGDDRTPAFRWLGCLYHDENHICVNSDSLSRCLMDAGAMVPVPGGRGGKTFKSQTQSGMKVDDLFVPVECDGKTISWPEVEKLMKLKTFPEHLQAVKKLGFSLMVKRAKIGATKHIRVRPRFDNWSLEFQMSVWDEQLTDDVLKQVLSYGGQYKGLGDWRPNSPRSPGPYGMYQLASLKQI